MKKEITPAGMCRDKASLPLYGAHVASLSRIRMMSLVMNR